MAKENFMATTTTTPFTLTITRRKSAYKTTLSLALKRTK
jgi:hypothetical protein